MTSPRLPIVALLVAGVFGLGACGAGAGHLTPAQSSSGTAPAAPVSPAPPQAANPSGSVPGVANQPAASPAAATAVSAADAAMAQVDGSLQHLNGELAGADAGLNTQEGDPSK